MTRFTALAFLCLERPDAQLRSGRTSQRLILGSECLEALLLQFLQIKQSVVRALGGAVLSGYSCSLLLCCSISSIFFRRLNGRMSVQTSWM